MTQAIVYKQQDINRNINQNEVSRINTIFIELFTSTLALFSSHRTI